MQRLSNITESLHIIEKNYISLKIFYLLYQPIYKLLEKVKVFSNINLKYAY